MKKCLSLTFVFIAVICFVTAAVNGSAPQKGKGKKSVAAIYADQCARCHGQDGKGLKSLEPPDFTNAAWQSKQTDAKFLKSIADGEGVMPGYRDSLSTAEMRALVKHVRAFARKK